MVIARTKLSLRRDPSANFAALQMRQGKSKLNCRTYDNTQKSKTTTEQRRRRTRTCPSAPVWVTVRWSVCGKSRKIECIASVWPNGVGKLRSAAAAGAWGGAAGGDEGSRSVGESQCDASTGGSIFLISTSASDSKSSSNNSSHTSCNSNNLESCSHIRNCCSNRIGNSSSNCCNSNSTTETCIATLAVAAVFCCCTFSFANSFPGCYFQFLLPLPALLPTSASTSNISKCNHTSTQDQFHTHQCSEREQ